MKCPWCKEEVIQVELFCPFCGRTYKFNIETPEMLRYPDLNSLRVLLDKHIKNIADGSYKEDNDDDHYIFEEAMKAFYGPDIFDWINKHN